MESLTDELLIESYYTAIKFEMNKEFIKLLEDEIQKRHLSQHIILKINHAFFQKGNM
jgi:developmental checkpoint coupling sporulation initiation to replication initiation